MEITNELVNRLFHAGRGEIEAIIKEALATAPVAVKVKPLEFTPWTGSASYAHTDFGDYTVEMDYDDDMAETPYVGWLNDESVGHFRTLAEAQSAIHEAHERCVLSAISPPDLASENARLRDALVAAKEELDRISCEGVTETRSVSEALDRAIAFANRGATAVGTALADQKGGA